jgi:hypothetical protein
MEGSTEGYFCNCFVVGFVYLMANVKNGFELLVCGKK